MADHRPAGRFPEDDSSTEGSLSAPGRDHGNHSSRPRHEEGRATRISSLNLYSTVFGHRDAHASPVPPLAMASSIDLSSEDASPYVEQLHSHL